MIREYYNKWMGLKIEYLLKVAVHLRKSYFDEVLRRSEGATRVRIGDYLISDYNSAALQINERIKQEARENHKKPSWLELLPIIP